MGNTKMCAECGELKDRGDFYLKDKKTGRLDTRCKVCQIANTKAYVTNHTYETFESQKRYREANAVEIAAKKAIYYEENKEHITKYKANWRKKNRERLIRNSRSYTKTDKSIYMRYKCFVKKKYNVSERQLRGMMDKSKGCCEICLESLDHVANKTFHIDHCHGTEGVRGLLCPICNYMLGNAKDKPSVLRRGAEYLERYTDGL